MPRAYISGYQPIAFADFSGGLNLRDKADVVTDREAIDLLNVTFTEHGAIRQRDGFSDLTPVDLANRVDSLSPFYTAGGLRQLIAGCGTRLEALDASGATLGALQSLGGGPWTFARFGSPGTESIYCANGIDTLRKWNGAAWSAPTGTVDGVAGRALPKAGSVCVTPAAPGATASSNANNRLLATAFGTVTNGGPNGAPTNPSRVWLSNPNQPEIWETDGDLTAKRGRNFIDLTPGDGEQIMAAVTWRELTFIFKETKFFVMWGESTGPDGYSPLFNYREVINNVGLAGRLAVTIGRDGVYFMARPGVYRTTGGDPVLLSDVIAPLWTGNPEIYYEGDPINPARHDLVRLLWHMEQLFVAVPTGARNACDRLLLYDTTAKWWTVYDIAASALTSFRRVDRAEVTHGYAAGTQRVGRRNYGSTVDRGATITSRWRSGWSDYGRSEVKTIRETKVWGAGVTTVGFSTDFNRTQEARRDALFGLTSKWPSTGTWADWLLSNNNQWPGGGLVSNALLRRAVRGTVFSTQFANSPEAPSWSVHRVVRHLREVREPSIR